MFEHLIENLKDMFAADPHAKGADEAQQQGVVDLYQDEEDEDIDSFFSSI